MYQTVQVHRKNSISGEKIFVNNIKVSYSNRTRVESFPPCIDKVF